MPSSTSNSDFQRPIPNLPWRGLLLSAIVIVALATIGWEIHCRRAGYAPTLNDSPDLWASRRAAVKSDSVVFIGDSRPWFDIDLDQFEKDYGHRPIQLAMGGGCAYPVLADLAADQNFRGTVICSVVPGLFMAPMGFPVEVAQKALKRYHHQTPAQRWSFFLTGPLENSLAFLKDGELTLADLLKQLPIANRAGALVAPPFPPYFNWLDAERRARMTELAEKPGELQDRIRQGWLPLFAGPPPPSWVPKEAFMQQIGQLMAKRMNDIAAAVETLRARGTKVVFVRFPYSGDLKKLEDTATPRPAVWDPLLKRTNVPGIYCDDLPELASFSCPEWSHLSASDSVEFTKRFIPHLQKALASDIAQAAKKTTSEQ
jgi:hypothetical protein